MLRDETRQRKARPVYLYNPLPHALRHYEAALQDALSESARPVVSVPATSIEVGARPRLGRAQTAVASILGRLPLLFRSAGDILVAWPAFGMLDVLGWLLLAVRHRVIVVVHDPVPIRPSFGYSSVHYRIAGLAVRLCRIELLTHSEAARTDLESRVHAAAIRMPLPMRRPHPLAPTAGQRRGPYIVKVLGQYKPVRDLEALDEISSHLADDLRFDLRVLGRGWPEMDGWHVTDAFIDEQRFANEIHEADCVVIPYVRYYQSDVMVRCLESSTAVVARRHEHAQELYGRDWPGLVDGSGGWADAIVRLGNLEAGDIHRRAAATHAHITALWVAFADAGTPSKTARRV